MTLPDPSLGTIHKCPSCSTVLIPDLRLLKCQKVAIHNDTIITIETALFQLKNLGTLEFMCLLLGFIFTENCGKISK